MSQRNQISTGAAILWGSAFLLAGMVIIQAGRMGGNAAHAEMTGSDGGYTLMTTSAGSGRADFRTTEHRPEAAGPLHRARTALLDGRSTYRSSRTTMTIFPLALLSSISACACRSSSNGITGPRGIDSVPLSTLLT